MCPEINYSRGILTIFMVIFYFDTTSLWVVWAPWCVTAWTAALDSTALAFPKPCSSTGIISCWLAVKQLGTRNYSGSFSNHCFSKRSTSVRSGASEAFPSSQVRRYKSLAVSMTGEVSDSGSYSYAIAQQSAFLFSWITLRSCILCNLLLQCRSPCPIFFGSVGAVTCRANTLTT